MQLLPSLELASVCGAEDVASDPFGVGRRECEIRLPDHIGTHVHVTEEIWVAEYVGGVAPGVAGLQADAIKAR
jgi:hypothetical protein